MYRYLTLLLVAITAMAGRADIVSPDFSMPRDVIADADAVLANRKTDAATRMAAVMQIVTATTAINPDSLAQMPDFVGQWAEKTSSADYRGLMTLYQARLISNFYGSHRWSAQNITDVAGELPDDMNRWSTAQFTTRINELTAEAVAILSPYMSRPLSQYAKVISLSAEMKPFFPTLGSFVYAMAYELSDRDGAYARAALANTLEGTPTWAWWTCRTADADAIAAAYDKYPGGIAGAYLLLNMAWDADTRYDLAEKIRTYLETQPANVITPALRSRLEQLTLTRIEFTSPQFVAAGRPVEIVCIYSDCQDFTVEVYKNESYSESYPYKNAKLYTSSRRPGSSAPGQHADTVRFNLPVGNYLVGVKSPHIDTTRRNYGNMRPLTVTPWMPLQVSSGKENRVVVANLSDGAPAAGVKVDCVTPVENTLKLFGVSDSEGQITFTMPKGYYNNWSTVCLNLSAGKKGSVFFTNPGRLNMNTIDRHYASAQGAIFVNRPLFHFGDTICWSAVISNYDYATRQAKLITDATIDAKLLDANRQEVATLRLTTDRLGQIAGTFAVPDDRMAGRYTINLYAAGNFIGSMGVTVSDFKMSQFEITDFTATRQADSFAISGIARRYSGAAVPDANVKVKISNAPYEFSMEREGMTDADGRFTIIIPADSLAIDCDDMYSRRCDCTATVTAQSGEAVDAAMTFYAGKPYHLIMASEGTFCSDEPFTFGVSATDIMSHDATLDATWQLYGANATKIEGSPLYSGKCRVGAHGAVLDLSGVPSGRYKLHFAADTTMVSGTDAMANIMIYSVKHNTVPDVDSFILTKTAFDDVVGDVVDVCVGVPTERYIYVVSYDNAGLPRASAHRLTAGFHNVSVPVGKDDTQQAWIVTFAADNIYTTPVTINRRVKVRELTLEGEAWRDRMVPGETERWTFRLTDTDNRGAARRLTATLYNHSLDALAPSAWSTNLSSMFNPHISRCNYWADIPYMGSSSATLTANYTRTSFNVQAPTFAYGSQIYDMNVKIRSSKMAMNSMAMATADVAAVGAAPMMAEAAEEDAAEVPYDGSAEARAADDFDYRSAEVLQGFWRPEVDIDNNGIATITFTVPNANAAWTLRSTAWTADCATASWQAVVTSAKPLMVQPSMPRFMRRGDEASLSFSIINNSDTAQAADTHVEFFNPATMATIAEYDFKNNLAANQQAVVDCKLAASTGLSEIGYRVRTTNGTFADGEQGVIPVLESAVTAIDADVFYLDSTVDEFTANIPAGADIVALQYCQNPVWDAVKALPGLYDAEPVTATAAASSAYAALTARMLLKRFPEIRRVLDIWESNPADSALVSKLNKNQDLKLELLSRTPFVGAANANTEQMQRLAATFDKATIDHVLKTAVTRLADLQMSDGGFAWGTWNRQSSVMMTEFVLMTLGRTIDLNNYAATYGLDKIIGKALAYLDANVSDNHNSSDYAYAYVYSLFPDRSPTTLNGQQCIDNTVQQLIKNWKSTPVASKARAAMILKSFGNGAVAAEIMRSVSQFATIDPHKGAQFASVRNVDFYSDLLMAYNRIDHTSALIDPIRKWLLLQTMANDDLGACDPTQLVAAIISSGTRWTAVQTDALPNVTIGGQELRITNAEAATGAFTMRVDKDAAGKQLVVRRTGDSPVAYGSLVTVADVPLASVQPRAGEDIAITKRLLVERDGKWVEATDFSLGERVRVELAVTTGRTFEYLTISDMRAACLEPVSQMPGMIWSGSAPAYRVVGDSATELFINYLPKGTYFFNYETTAATAGNFASGTATIQSQYAPEFTARSGAVRLSVR